LVLLGSGPFTLNSSGNDVATLAADLHNGSINYTDANDLQVGTVQGVAGITTGGPAAGGAVVLTAPGSLTVAQPINTQPGSGGSLIVSGAVALNATVTLGAGSVILTGGSLGTADVTILAAQTADSINIQAPRDIIVAAQLVARSGDVTLTADTAHHGIGGVWVQAAGLVSASGNVALTGSDLFATASASDSVRIDSDGANVQVAAGGSATLQPNQGSFVSGSAGTIVAGTVSAGSGPLVIAAAHTILLSSTLTSAGNSVTLTAPVLLTGNAALTAGNAIAITGKVDADSPGTRSLTLTAGAGDITLGGAVGGAGRLGVLSVVGGHNLSAPSVTATALAQQAGTGLTALGNLDVNGPAGISLASHDFSLTGTITLSGAGPLFLAAAGSVNLSGPAVNLSGGDFTIVNAGAGLISAAIAGPSALIKSGGGTLSLLGINSYTGATTVNGGTLVVDGLLGPGGQTVSVGSGGTLAGIGLIERPINVGKGGVLSPGENGVGQLTTGSVVFNPGSVFLSQINGDKGYGQLSANGSVNLGNATLSLGGGFAPAPGTVLTLITTNGNGPVIPGFNGLAEDALVNVGSFTGYLSYIGGIGNDVTLTVTGPVSFAGGDNLLLRRNEGSLQFFRDGVLVDSRPLVAVTDYSLKGSEKGSTSLTLDFATGGVFTIGGAVTFTGGGSGSVHVVGGSFLEIDDILAGPDGGPMTLTAEAGQALQLNYGGVAVVDLTQTSSVALSIRLSDSADLAVLEQKGGVSSLASVGGAFTTTFFSEPKGKLIVDTAGGDDNLTVIRTAPTAAPLTTYGGEGTNILALDLSAATSPDVLTLTASTLTSTALGGPITFAGTLPRSRLTCCSSPPTSSMQPAHERRCVSWARKPALTRKHGEPGA